jgi:protein-S-isoprenylcysteine O-methyltransferase Ste14
LDHAEHRPPPSATRLVANLSGLACGLLALLGSTSLGLNVVVTALLVLVAAALPIAVFDLAVLGVHRRESAGLGPPGPVVPERVAVKLIGLLATLAVTAAVYATLPLYRQPMFAPFMAVAILLLPVALVLAVPYFVWVDRRMRDPRDGYLELGQLVLGRWRGRDRRQLVQHGLGWVIKGFFLPLMFVYLLWAIQRLTARPLGERLASAAGFHELTMGVALFLDLVIVVIGYVATLRLFDSHIRSCNPLLHGWVVTLACYHPFWLYISPILAYRDGLVWTDWLGGHPVLLVVCGAAVVACQVGWVCANACFGLRFSNLTHRGILTGGPFRLTKHPSYVCKNLGWWLVAMPFLSTRGWPEALTNCLMLLTINLVYVLRARAEERHLSEDPTYVAYALWMERHGALRWVGRLVPWLRYRPPDATAPVSGAPSPRLHGSAG